MQKGRNTDHETEIEKSIVVQVVQTANLFAKHDAGDHSGTRGTETSTQRDGVDDVHVRLDGERALVMTSQDVQGDSGNQVSGRI